MTSNPLKREEPGNEVLEMAFPEMDDVKQEKQYKPDDMQKSAKLEIEIFIYCYTSLYKWSSDLLFRKTLYILVRADVMECAGDWNVLVHLITCAYYYMCNTLPLLKETKQNKQEKNKMK